MVGVLQRIQQGGLLMPKAVSLIGYGDPDWFAAYAPGITTVDFSLTAMISAAVDCLFGAPELSNPQASAARLKVLPRLVVRGTTAVFGKTS